MTRVARTIDELRASVGHELGLSEWLTVEQEMIDGFGRSTLDMDWMHVDPARAASEGPFGGPIAFGFWSLSLLTYFSHEIGMWPRDVAYGLNYGLEKVRWLTPVPVGARVRLRCHLIEVVDKGDDRILVRTRNSLEIDGEDRPALVAEWLGLFVQSEPVGRMTHSVPLED